MSLLRGLRFRHRCGTSQRKPASSGCATRRRVAISRTTLVRRRSGSIDQSPNCRKRSLASAPRRISVPRWSRSEKRLRGSGTIRSTQCLAGKPTALSLPKKDKRGSARRPRLGSASLPRRAPIPVRRSGAPPSLQRSRDNLYPLIIPITLPVRPDMVTLRAILMHGRHPDPGSFGKGRPSPECRTPL
jgi:hypothetical protein